MNLFWYTDLDKKDYVLIDTWWNVNVNLKLTCQVENFVLIDTWWNVNLVREAVARQGYGVLIDTWWNVNITFDDDGNITDIGFNRYMVECE